ncbi:MAG: glycosyltransferase family 9 protein [Ignavibacteriota bacterium]
MPHNDAPRMILVVRLGAMGDILHTLPAVRALKLGHPESALTWVVEPKWAPLLEQNPFVDRVVKLQRGSLKGLAASYRALRESGYRFAVDFQGLLKSAMVAVAAHPGSIYGFDGAQVRERAAAWFYRHTVFSSAAHVVDRHLDLAAAAGGVRDARPEFPLPPGASEGELPAGEFVLVSPFAGWASKQWPMAYYRALADLVTSEWKMPLVLNGAPGTPFGDIGSAIPHYSGLPGLIYATRRATAVVGVDSGPLHLAAALGKPGVAIFGPTDPSRNGPYGASVRGPAECHRGHHLQAGRHNRRQHAKYYAKRCVPSIASGHGVPLFMIRFPKPYADVVSRLRVPSGFLIVLVFAWFSHPTPLSLEIGLPIAVLGLALRAWAAGCLAKNQELAIGGPYAYTRNPLYLGTLVVAAGLSIAARSVGLGALFIAVFVFVYLPVIQNESEHLHTLFRDYAAYSAAVPLLLPRLTPHRAKSSNPFRLALYLTNQEYNAGVGLTVGMLFLLWKLVR